MGRASGEGHDRRAYRAGSADGGGGRAVVFSDAITAEEAAGPDRPQLHQPAPAESWWAVRVGVRERQAQDERTRRRAARSQQRPADGQRGAGRIRLGLCTGGHDRAPPRYGSSQARPRGLVLSIIGLPPLLPEPPPLVTGICAAGGCAALPWPITRGFWK